MAGEVGDVGEVGRDERRRRRRWMKPFVVAAGLAAALAVAEAALRAGPPRRAGFSSEAVFGRHDELLGWTNRADVAGRYEDPFEAAVRCTITLDARGLRVAPGAPAPVASAARVLVVGDSLTFGHGVDDGQTFAARLAAPGREVLNLGVCGYSVAQMLLRLERDGLPLEPDVVVLAVIADDLRRATETWASNGFPRPRLRLDGDGRLSRPAAALPAPLPAGQELPAESGSRLLDAAGSAAGWFAARLQGTAPAARGEAWTLGRTVVLEAARVARARGARFVLALLPEPDELRRGQDAPLRLLLAGLAVEGLEVVDVVPAMRAKGGAWLLLPRDGHPNAEGHRVIAARLEPALAAPR